MNNMHNNKIFLGLVALMALLSGCGDFLDVVPEKDITTIPSLFQQRTKVDEWEADCYSFITGLATPQGNIALTASDEFVGNQYLRDQIRYPLNGLLVGDGVQNVQSPYGDIWRPDRYYDAIRYCNIFIDNTPNTYNMTEVEKKQWIAEVKVLKAFLYFDLVRHYGPITLVPKNISVESSIEDMKQPRRPVEECFQAMLSLIDDAMANGLLPKAQQASSHSAYFNRESALALKAMILIYRASPLFNGNSDYTNFKNKQGEQLFPTQLDNEKWHEAALACDTAIAVAEQSGFSLVSGSTSKSTALLNTMQDCENRVLAPAFNNSEALFLVKYPNTNMYAENKLYAYTLPRFQSSDWSNYNSSVYGSLSPTMKMVEMYYTANGLPTDEDPTWDYTGRFRNMTTENDQSTYSGVIPADTRVLQEHLRREPRFYADIAADRTYFQRGPAKQNAWSTDYNLLVKAHQGESFGTQASYINPREPQNLSGYWLKKGLYSSIGTRAYANDYAAKGDDPYPVIRLAELYLWQAEAWNEYAGPSEKVYNALNKVRLRAGIPTVQTSWSRAKHPDDIKNQAGMRKIIQQETNIETSFEGRRYWNLLRWKEGTELGEPLKGWNIVGSTNEAFYNNWQGPVTVWSKRKFVAPRDYFFPIRSEERMNAGIVQNPGW